VAPTVETVLQGLGVPLDSCGLFLDAARWLEASGGPAASSYWTAVDLPLVDRQRDEFFVAGALALIGAHLVAAEPGGSDWRIRYDGAYLFETKPLAQTICSIDLLCSARCYVDAISVVRTLQSRVQLLVLFSLGPHLFDEWLVDSGAKKFRDGEVRKELAAHSLDIFPHLYHWFSDVVHGRGEG